MQYTKISATSLEVTKEIITPVKTETQTYERKFIEDQIKAITAQRDELIAIKEAELKECQDILAEMNKLGIKVEEVKPLEVIK
jgi:predicted lactoylglutathione lyase